MFDLFDFDEDGIMDTAEFTVGMMIIEDVNKKEEDEEDEQENQKQQDEIEAAGLDYDDLENMDEEERAKVLREAGLDPEDFDF